MEFSFDANNSSSGSDSTIQSDRLRKAIERNRAKQVKRTSSPRTIEARAKKNLFQSDPLNDEAWSLPGRSNTSNQRTNDLRRNVAQADNVEFTQSFRKSKNVPAPVSYSSNTSIVPVRKSPPRKKTSSLRKKSGGKSQLLVIKGVWVFCLFLLLRLIFSNGGVLDYYDKKDHLEERKNEQVRIENENAQLLKEIELLKKDPSYQKKVVRDHLGYIAQDEYLILFSQ